jgi:Predicted membrane protein
MRPLLWLKGLIWLACLAPLAWLAWRVLQHDLGPNPVQTLEYFTGRWALRLLLVTLAMTPLRWLSGRTEPIQVRRLLGLWTFAYACLHFIVFLTFDLRWAPGRLAHEIAEKPFILAGFATWLLLLPLALTSTRGWQRRLGRRWKMLHRLIYAAGAGAVLHYWWGVKLDLTWPQIYLALLVLVLAPRLPVRRWSRAILGGQPT